MIIKQLIIIDKFIYCRRSTAQLNFPELKYSSIHTSSHILFHLNSEVNL